MKPLEQKMTYDSLSEVEREAIALEYLRRLTPGYQEIQIFKELARLGGLATVELLPVRTPLNDKDGVEVLLARRPADSDFWPNLLHVAGSIIREDDPIENEHDYTPAISRTMAEFGGNLSFIAKPIEMETVHRRGDRSRELTVRFWGEVEGEPERGEFHDAAGVLRRAPELGIFDSHAAFIERATVAYGSLRADR